MKNHLFLLSLLLLSSCSRKVLIQEAYLIETDRKSANSDIDIRTHYVGDAFQYITFQIDIENNSEDTLFVSERDVELRTRHERSRRGNIAPIRKEQLIQDLVAEQEQLQYEKQANTATSVVFSGLNVVTRIIAGGTPTDAVIQGTVRAADIMEERRQYNAAQGSIEDQIIYLEDYTLGEDFISPGESGSYDVHFERLLIEGRCELVIYSTENPHATQYEFEVQKVRMRD